MGVLRAIVKAFGFLQSKIRPRIAEIVLLLGACLIALRLFFPPLYMEQQKSRQYISYYQWINLSTAIKNSNYPDEEKSQARARLNSMTRYDYSLAILHSIGIAVISGTIYFVKRRSTKFRG